MSRRNHEFQSIRSEGGLLSPTPWHGEALAKSDLSTEA
jgi:hypothetical protein